MAGRDRQSANMLRFARATGAAWAEMRKAEVAMSRCARRDPKLQLALEAVQEATGALRRAYGVVAPKRKRDARREEGVQSYRRQGGATQELWRCRYCPALVFTRDRRVHLEYEERITTEALDDGALAAHFEVAQEPEATDDEDALDGW